MNISFDTSDISMEDIFMVFAILIGIFLVSVIALNILKRKRDAEDDEQPTLSKKAKVIDKQQLPPNTIMSISEMWVLFETEDGQRLRLNAKAINNLVVGDEGYLTWQGRRIINFERDKTIER